MSLPSPSGLTVDQVLEITGGTPAGPAADSGKRFVPALPAAAGPGSLVTAWESRAVREALERGAGLLVAAETLLPDAPSSPAVAVRDARLAFARLSAALVPDRRAPSGIDPAASVHPDATLGSGVRVGPFASIGAGSVIGAGTSIGAGSTIGRNCEIGAGSIIHAGVHVYDGVIIGQRAVLHSGCVIGADGFGFAASPAGPVKIEHLGTVTLGDDVEIGAGSTIDRGTVGVTAIGDRTKVDNLVQIGHNVTAGTDCLIAGQSAIGGSTVLGDRVTLAGNAAIADHVSIGNDAVIGALSGVSRDVPAGEFWFGIPAEPRRDWVRRRYLTGRLGEIWEYVKGQRGR